MAMWLDYKPTRYEGKGFLRKIYLIMKATTHGLQSQLRQPPPL